jgi:beta-alanine degradation protein BauB
MFCGSMFWFCGSMFCRSVLCRLLCAAVIAGLAANFAAAQDPTKVAPKHYKLAFENEYVQVLSVHYGPHEKSQMHEHPAGVVVNLTSGHLRFTDQNGKVQEAYSLAGETRWFPAAKHTVENLGDEPFNAVYIGIKGKLTKAAADAKPDTPPSPGQLSIILAEYAQAMAKP